MRLPAALLLLAGTTLAMACDAPPTTQPSDPGGEPGEAVVRPTERFSAVGLNIYVGANVDKVLAALLSPDPTDDIPTLVTQAQTLYATDFPTRAAAIVEAVARTRPHVVGLNEVSTIDIDLSPLGGPSYHMDMVAVLEAAFAMRGLPYQLVGRNLALDVAPAPGIRLVDEDVVFMDTERAELAGPVFQKQFQYNIGAVAPGVSLTRGYLVVPVGVGGRVYTVAATHLEDDLGDLDITSLRYAQMAEILQVIGSRSPAIIIGDLNDFAGSPMHSLALSAGFHDVWADLRPGTEGFTCCHKADLSNPVPVGQMDQRLDFMLARGFHEEAGRVRGQVARLGYEPSTKVPGPYYPLWLSDHAGLTATLRPAAN